MKHVGWLVNGTFYKLSDFKRVEMIMSFQPNVDVVEIFAARDVCIKY